MSTKSGSHKPIQIFLVIGIAVAFIGFFVGTRSGSQGQHTGYHDPPAQRPGGQAIPARSYTEILSNPLSENDHWKSSIAQLAAERPELYAEVKNSPELLAKALAERANNRAYAGAPPTVPHPVKQTGDLACAACHTDGLEVRGRVASPMSHPFMTNCTQCHVPSNPAGPDDPELLGPMSEENTFVGMAEPSGGPVAWMGAPPQIPHQTWMRNECASCHGSLGKAGMKSTHPWRQNCMQCHAPSAQFDQDMPPATLAPAMPLATP